jgi:hypothetical protein
MGEYKLDVDEEKNRLYLKMEGHFEADEGGDGQEELLRIARELDDGFEMITDLSEFEPASPEVADSIDDGKQILARNGLAASVRVTPESTTGKLQFERAGKEAESYQVAEAETVDQAERLLDQR